MSLLGLRTAIVAKIHTEISSLRTCQAHGGRFDLRELQRWAMQSPAVLVSILGGALEREGGANVVDAKVVAFIFTPGTSASHRDSASLSLVDLVAALVCTDAWDYEHAQAPQGMNIENLYAGDIDKQGVALWAITWTQRTDIGIVDTSEFDDFRLFSAKWDIMPSDGIVDAEDRVEPRGMLMEVYGNLHVIVPAATNVVVPGTYYKAAGTTELDVASTDVDMPANNRLRYTGDITRPFLVRAALSVSIADDLDLSVAFAKNGVVVPATSLDQTAASPDKQGFVLSSILELKKNDYIEVWVTATGVTTATMHKVKIAMVST